jgi:ABC-2 type transport system permease protein
MKEIARLYRLFLSLVVTKGRLAGLLALSAVVVVIGFAIGHNDHADRLDDGTSLIASVGLSLVAPIVTLVLASAVLGDPTEDGTLVYLWLRPVARWKLTVSAMAAGFTVSLPIVLVPTMIAASLTGAGNGIVGATAAAGAVAVAAYTGLFTLLGLRVKRALAWGLAYILVWEGFVARAGRGAALFSVRAHTQSILTRMVDGPIRFEHSTMRTAIFVPLFAALIAGLLTTYRLRRATIQ